MNQSNSPSQEKKNDVSRPRKLILRNSLSPGDIVMLTAAVRDIHKCCPGEFLTDIRTPCPDLWQNNPYITPIDDEDSEAESINCEYPLINRSNQEPWHFLHGFSQFLSDKLGRKIYPTEYRGDIHISELEKSWYSQVTEIVGIDVPFWLIVAGGKFDFTIKWWDHQRFQKVVDHFGEKMLFVQIGDSNEHNHPPLKGVLDLRGKTDIRQLVRLTYHSYGTLCPVTMPMHLTAAVETRSGGSNSRPCVVVAGGREPPHWEAYPSHQFIHPVGALSCCASGGCWKSRTVPLGDGDKKDHPSQLCLDVVKNLPRCMDMITPGQVASAIRTYIKGGEARFLTPSEQEYVRPHRNQ